MTQPSSKLDETFMDIESGDSQEIQCVYQNLCPKMMSIILKNPIITDDMYLEKDIVTWMGNLITEYSEFNLFENNSNMQNETNIFLNNKRVNYQSTFKEELNQSLSQKRFGIFLKFNCSKSDRRIKEKIKIGNDLINLMKRFLNQNTCDSQSNFIDIFFSQMMSIIKQDNI